MPEGLHVFVCISAWSFPTVELKLRLSKTRICTAHHEKKKHNLPPCACVSVYQQTSSYFRQKAPAIIHCHRYPFRKRTFSSIIITVMFNIDLNSGTPFESKMQKILSVQLFNVTIDGSQKHRTESKMASWPRFNRYGCPWALGNNHRSLKQIQPSIW